MNTHSCTERKRCGGASPDQKQGGVEIPHVNQPQITIPMPVSVIRMHQHYGSLPGALAERVTKAKKAGAAGPFNFSVIQPAPGNGVTPFTDEETTAFQAVAAQVPQ